MNLSSDSNSPRSLRPGWPRVLLVAVVCAGLSLSLPLSARPQKGEVGNGEKLVNEIFAVEHVDVRHLDDLLKNFGLAVEASQELRTVSLRGREDDVAAAVRAIERLDVAPRPSKHVEVVAHILMASRDEPFIGDGDSEIGRNLRAELENNPIPKNLQPVVAELEKLFGYRSFLIAEQLIVRAREGSGGWVEGALPMADTATAEGDEETPRVETPKQRAGLDDAALRTVLKTLAYADAQDLLHILTSGQGDDRILSSRGAIKVDRRTNTLIIREHPKAIDTLLAIMENLDTPGNSDPFSLRRRAKRTMSRFGFEQATLVPGDDSYAIRLDGLDLRTHGLPFGPGQQEPGSIQASIRTDIEVREGQVAVVGKAAVDRSNDAVILIVEARVVD